MMTEQGYITKEIQKVGSGVQTGVGGERIRIPNNVAQSLKLLESHRRKENSTIPLVANETAQELENPSQDLDLIYVSKILEPMEPSSNRKEDKLEQSSLTCVSNHSNGTAVPQKFEVIGPGRGAAE